MSLSWRAMAIPVTALLLWELAANTGLIDLEFLSRPSHILVAGISGLADGTFLYTTWQTLEAACSVWRSRSSSECWWGSCSGCRASRS